MRNLSLLSQESRNSLNSILPINNDVVCIALAKVLADKMPLPTAPIDNVEELYTNIIKSSNFDIMWYIGEMLPLNYDMVEDNIRLFWKLRYELLHNSNYKLTIGKNALDFFGIGFILSPVSITVIEENSEVLCFVYNRFINIVKDIENRIIKDRS